MNGGMLGKFAKVSVPSLVKESKPKSSISIQRFGKMFFLKVGDGTGPETLQAVVNRKLCKNVNVGSAVVLSGDWTESEGSQQPMELIAGACEVVGMKEEKMLDANIDLLRQNVHLRAKDPSYAAVLRLTSRLNFITHQFFMERGFHHIHTPTTSRNDCEGAGETFSIKASSGGDDFFGPDEHASAVYLPVSSQLHLEAISTAIPNVYTISPAFRAEKSQDSQHLAEFRMLEAECAFMDSVDELCSLVEDYLKWVCVKLLECCGTDLAASENFCSASQERLLGSLDAGRGIPRVTYSQAIEILGQSGEPRGPGSRPLSRREELALVGKFNGPLFVTHFPSTSMPFYMRRTEDGSEAECFDLLAPLVGELAGGSVREKDEEKMRSRLRGDVDKLRWYFDLRKQGYPHSSGFGLGVERLVQTLFGIRNIRDTVPFPRWFGHCPC